MMKLADAINLLNHQQQKNATIMQLRLLIENEYPNTIKALRFIDAENSRRRQREIKGFNLVKVKNKKLGYVYYVRYSHEGKMLPSKWNTGTNNNEEAELFARENKTRLVEAYLHRHEAKLYSIFEEFYKIDSDYLNSEKQRSRSLSEKCRKEYNTVCKNKFIPFLRERNINKFDQITVRTLMDFQDMLLARGIKPQTANKYINAVKRVLRYLARKGILHDNPGDRLKYIPVQQGDQTVRGCYDVDQLKGIFNKKWKDELSYLLCMLIYTTGMRNSEIKRIKKSDIIDIDDFHFIDIKESKTQSGIRLVPLHEFVYQRLMAYARAEDSDKPLFAVHASFFACANEELAQKLKISPEKMEEEQITFYSGRHFWKTLMNREDLGTDIEEYFMGHKVSNDVAKRYNHRDKQGKKLMVKKAKQVFTILDRHIFTKI